MYLYIFYSILIKLRLDMKKNTYTKLLYQFQPICINSFESNTQIDTNDYCKASWCQSLKNGMRLQSYGGWDTSVVNIFPIIFDKDDEDRFKPYSPKPKHGAYGVAARDIIGDAKYTWNLC